MQKCDIGLSTQNPEGLFNDTSFPCKILSYMANGLRVVSVRIPVIETSSVGTDVYYYENQTVVDIADTIKGINLKDGYNGRKRIEDLNKMFVNEIGKFLEETL